MTVTIYRGTHQIGGCVTEYRTKTTRILVDLGSPLPGAPEQEPIRLPGVTEPGEPCQGVFFTHYHGDHMGEIYRVLPNVPLWMGETAREVAKVLYLHLQRVPDACVHQALDALERTRTFCPGKPVTVGDLKITPIMEDHSAFDAYQFLIEGEGVRVLHTGDFRIHGPRGKGLKKALQRYVGQVDWVVCEGTTLSRPAEKMLTERELGQLAQQIMGRYRYVFALCSSTNIDRIATLYQANPQGRLTICDRYQKEVLKRIQRRHGVKSSFYRFDRVWCPYSESFQSRLWKYASQQGFLIFVRPTIRFRNIMERYRENSIILYSQWSGYREGSHADPRIQQFLKGFPVIPLHTSGHADPATLREICQLVNPRGIIPIHGERPEAFRELLPGTHVVCLEDGECLSL